LPAASPPPTPFGLIYSEYIARGDVVQESFTKDDEHLLGAFMAQAGLAIENERLHARVQALEAACKCGGASTRYPNRL
jgi:GAF domain-containing protein